MYIIILVLLSNIITSHQMDNIDGTQFSSLLGIINKWNPDNVTIPIDFIDLLPLFNFSNLNERKIAKKYRDAEIPFKIYNFSLAIIIKIKFKIIRNLSIHYKNKII